MFEVKVHSSSQWKSSICLSKSSLGTACQSFEGFEDIKELIGTDILEAFQRLDIKLWDKREPTGSKTSFHWAVFRATGVCKSNTTHISVSCLSISSEENLNNTLRNFWEMDSAITNVSDEDKLSQDGKNCLAHLIQWQCIYK